MKIRKNQIPGYEITKVVATGGMGTVFEAHQLSLDKPVAIKVLSPKLASDKGYVERFVREARSLASLNHQNVVTVIDVGESGGHYFLVMEFVEGESLAELIDRQGCLSEEKALSISRAVACALVHAEKNSLIHRDIKPDNILISGEGTPKLCDLGLARPAGSSTNLTAAGVAIGTPEYIAPEQARGESELDIRTDIYSLGATLYECVTGKAPFDGPTPAHIMRAHIDEPLGFPEEPKLGEPIKNLISKMMSKKPEHRQQSAAELLSDIDRVSAGEAPSVIKKESEKLMPGIPDVIKNNFAILGGALGAAVVAIILLALLVPAPEPENPEEPDKEAQDIDLDNAGASRFGRRAMSPEEVTPQSGDNEEVEEVEKPKLKERRASAIEPMFEAIIRMEENEEARPHILIKMYEEFAREYPDTEWAPMALERAQALEKKISEKQAFIEREYEKAAAESVELLKRGRYHEAILGLENFSEIHEGTPSARKAHWLAGQYVTSAARHFANICRQSLALARKGDYEMSRKLLASVEKTGIHELDEMLEKRRRKIDEMENRDASQREETRRLALYDEVTEMLIEKALACDINGAIELLKDTRARDKFEPIDRLLSLDINDLDKALSLLSKAELGLKTRTGSTEQLKYRNGSGIWGEVVHVGNGAATLSPRGKSGQAVTIEIEQLDDGQIINFAAYSDDPPSEYDKLTFLLARGNGTKASEIMQEANLNSIDRERLGKKLLKLRNTVDENEASGLASQMEGAYKSRRFATTGELASRLFMEYAHTDFLIEHAPSLGRYVVQPGLIRVHSKVSSFRNTLSADSDPLPSFAVDKSLLDRKGTLHVRWEGMLNILEDYEYTFYVLSSVPTKMELDGRSVLRLAPESEIEIDSTTKKLRKGMTEFQLEISCKSDDSAITHVFWQRGDGPRMPLSPTDVVYLPIRKDEYQEKLK